MTQEEKQLLLQDLCARLLCGVQGITSDGIVSPLIVKGEADWDILTSLNYRIVKHGWKPYLRNLSSMTEDEFDEFSDIIIPVDGGKAVVEEENLHKYVDFCNSHYLDWRNLIPMGLAIEAPKDMYNIKKK